MGCGPSKQELLDAQNREWEAKMAAQQKQFTKQLQEMQNEVERCKNAESEMAISLEASLQSTNMALLAHQQELGTANDMLEEQKRLLQQEKQLLHEERAKLETTLVAKADLENQLVQLDKDISTKREEIDASNVQLELLAKEARQHLEALKEQMEAEITQKNAEITEKNAQIDEQTQSLESVEEHMRIFLEAVQNEVQHRCEMDQEMLNMLSDTHRDAIMHLREQRTVMNDMASSLDQSEQIAAKAREENQEQQELILRQQQRILLVENRHEKLWAILSHPQTRVPSSAIASASSSVVKLSPSKSSRSNLQSAPQSQMFAAR